MTTLTAQSRQLFLIALMCALGAVAVAGYLLLDIKLSGAKLEEAMRAKVAKEQRIQEQTRHSQLLEQTKDERSQLAAAFLSSENEGIELLNTIETEAPKAGLTLTDSFIERVVDPQKPEQNEIVMRFAYSGGEAAVYDFSRMLETMPLHAQVEKLQLGKEGDEWKAQTEIRITIRTP